MSAATSNSHGFTLLEILMTLILVGVLAAVAVTTITSSVSNENFDATLSEMNLIRNAIVGDPAELTRGVRASFGYWGDVGALPAALGDLLVIPGGVSASATSTANRTVFGWKGPYLPTSDPAVDYLRDGWGNLYVWTPGAGTPTLVSLGSDGAVGGTGLAQDITIEFPASGRVATVNGFIVTTGAGAPITQSADVTIYYPNGTGGSASSGPITVLAGASGYFSFSNIPFGTRSLIFKVPSGAVPTFGPVIFNVDRANYTIPVSLTRTGNPCTTQTIQFSAATSSVIESTTARNIVVQASATCIADMTVDYVLADGTAVAPGDYTAASGTLTIPAGSTTVNLPVTVVNDAAFEVTETLTATLSNPSTGFLGATSVNTHSITNDDAAACVAGNTTRQGTAVTFTVPADCTSLVVKAWGAGGGAGQTSGSKAADGGPGGYTVISSFAVTPGEIFTVTTGTGGRGGGSGCGAGGAGADIGGTEGVSGAGGPGGGALAGGTGGARGQAGTSFAGGNAMYGGGGGGAGNGAANRGGGGGGSTSVYRNSTTTTIARIGGGGGGGGSANGGPGNAGSGGSGCSGIGGDGSAGQARGGGGGGGRCTGGTPATGTGVNPSNSAQAGVGVATGGAAGGTCATAGGGAGLVRFEYN